MAYLLLVFRWFRAAGGGEGGPFGGAKTA